MTQIPRQHGRYAVDSDAVLLFPSRNAHPRIKAHLFQIGEGGCALSTKEHLFIGEECRVWATDKGRKFFEAPGTIVWMKSEYDGGQQTLLGIEFKAPVVLSPELLEKLNYSVAAAAAQTDSTE